MNFKTIAYWLGLAVIAVVVFRFLKKASIPDLSTPRVSQTPEQKFLDDNAPAAIYAIIVPPIAQNVYPNASSITMKRNDSVLPPQYNLPAIGPNGNS